MNICILNYQKSSLLEKLHLCSTKSAVDIFIETPYNHTNSFPKVYNTYNITPNDILKRPHGLEFIYMFLNDLKMKVVISYCHFVICFVDFHPKNHSLIMDICKTLKVKILFVVMMTKYDESAFERAKKYIYIDCEENTFDIIYTEKKSQNNDHSFELFVNSFNKYISSQHCVHLLYSSILDKFESINPRVTSQNEELPNTKYLRNMIVKMNEYYELFLYYHKVFKSDNYLQSLLVIISLGANEVLLAIQKYIYPFEISQTIEQILEFDNSYITDYRIFAIGFMNFCVKNDFVKKLSSLYNKYYEYEKLCGQYSIIMEILKSSPFAFESMNKYCSEQNSKIPIDEIILYYQKTYSPPDNELIDILNRLKVFIIDSENLTRKLIIHKHNGSKQLLSTAKLSDDPIDYFMKNSQMESYELERYYFDNHV